MHTNSLEYSYSIHIIYFICVNYFILITTHRVDLIYIIVLIVGIRWNDWSLKYVLASIHSQVFIVSFWEILLSEKLSID